MPELSRVRLDDETRADLELAVHLRSRRMVEGDPKYGVDTLGDIGMTTLAGGATDLGVGGNCIHSLLSLAAWEGKRDPPPRGFEVHGVKIDLQQRLLTEEALRQLAHMNDRCVRLGYWLLTEKLLNGLGPYLRALAENGPPGDRYRDATEFVESTLETSLAGYRDDAALARMVKALRDTEGELREGGHAGSADALHHAVEEAAAAARRHRERDLGPRTLAALEAAARPS